MTTSQIIALVIGVLFLVIILWQCLKYRFYKFNETEIIFWRLWFFRPKLRLQKEVITEICEYCLMDKRLDYELTTNKKKYKIPGSIDSKYVQHFGMKNFIKLTKEECYHGGGISIFYEPNSKNK